jgi:hypothetical protein
MFWAPRHHLSAGVVKYNHTEHAKGLLEGEELAYLQLMGDGEGSPPRR